MIMISRVLFNKIITDTSHANQFVNARVIVNSLIKDLYKHHDNINYYHNPLAPRNTGNMSSDQMQGIIITDIIKLNNNNVRDDCTLYNPGTDPCDDDTQASLKFWIQV